MKMAMRMGMGMETKKETEDRGLGRISRMSLAKPALLPITAGHKASLLGCSNHHACVACSPGGKGPDQELLTDVGVGVHMNALYLNMPVAF